MLSVSPLGVWGGGRKVGGEVRTLPAFLDFEMLSLGGDARDFLRAFSLVFVCASQECSHAGTFAVILWISGPFS